MFNAFRAISIVEGISYLVILSVAFGLIGREYVFLIGMTHGVLFVLYLVLSLLVSNKQGWSILVWLALFLASVIPLAFIPVELYLKKVSANHFSEPAEQTI